MSSKRCLALTLLVTLAVTSASSLVGVARADEVYTFVVKKQEEKQKTRWSLAEWLDTRDRMRLMDMWLALHSPSPYEFFIGGDYHVTDRDTTGAAVGKSLRLTGAAYVSIFGLEAQRRFSPLEEWLGLFNLRVFGFHQQSTNITLNAGIRSRDNGGAATHNTVLGGAMTIYIGRYFGIDGMYRLHLQEEANTLGLARSGNSMETGLFLDFNFARVYGHYFRDSDTDAVTSVASSHSGAQLGLRLYF